MGCDPEKFGEIEGYTVRAMGRMVINYLQVTGQPEGMSISSSVVFLQGSGTERRT